MPESKNALMAADDRISALPDAILNQVLSFLQAREAVQSCVLARRWRHFWKFLPVLRVTGGRVEESREFMEHLLILRGHSPLDACIFKFDRIPYNYMRYVMLWIRYALQCQVRVLHVAFSRAVFWHLSSVHLVAQNLTELKLDHVCVQDDFLDFSNCTALEELKMTECYINSDWISSPSLKSLSIVECYLGEDTRIRISTPSLISLQIISSTGVIPLLEDMPWLVTATVTFLHECGDSRARLEERETVCGDASCECCHGNSYCGDACCECCYGPADASNAGCVLLNGLAAATNVKLVAESEVFILERDLRWCPTFSNLKTLFLNGFCLAADQPQRALICILQHSPVLENLTLQLSKTPKDSYPMKTTYHVLEQPVASENLKKVEVTCQDVDKRVHNIMKSLSSYGIPLEKIYIRQTNKSSECFNYICTVSTQSRGEKIRFVDGFPHLSIPITKCMKRDQPWCCCVLSMWILT